jgi:hypothetical protein
MCNYHYHLLSFIHLIKNLKRKSDFVGLIKGKKRKEKKDSAFIKIYKFTKCVRSWIYLAIRIYSNLFVSNNVEKYIYLFKLLMMIMKNIEKENRREQGEETISD